MEQSCENAEEERHCVKISIYTVLDLSPAGLEHYAQSISIKNLCPDQVSIKLPERRTYSPANIVLPSSVTVSLERLHADKPEKLEANIGESNVNVREDIFEYVVNFEEGSFELGPGDELREIIRLKYVHGTDFTSWYQSARMWKLHYAELEKRYRVTFDHRHYMKLPKSGWLKEAQIKEVQPYPDAIFDEYGRKVLRWSTQSETELIAIENWDFPMKYDTVKCWLAAVSILGIADFVIGVLALLP